MAIASTGPALAQSVPFTDFPETPNREPTNEFLSRPQVRQILRQMVAEADARGMPGTFAVCDRVGNMLAVYEMNDVPIDAPNAPLQQLLADNGLPSPVQTQQVDPDAPQIPRDQANSPVFNGTLTGITDIAFTVLDAVGGNPLSGLNFANLPATLTSISKCGTAAYLSSNGNAFSSRTASQIIQENFNPSSFSLDSGPLFGVQFSQLPCSDFNTRFESDNGGVIEPTAGPRRLPIGFSADPGSLPLYENGTLVGAVGVAADPLYTLDRVVQGKDFPADELIARAGTRNFNFDDVAPEFGIRADRINVDGRSLRVTDAELGDMLTTNSDANAVNLATAGRFLDVQGYNDGVIQRGTAFGFSGSGFIEDPDDIFASSIVGHNQAFVVADSNDVNRFPPRNTPSTTLPVSAGGLTAFEVRTILDSAFEVLSNTRGLILRPLGSHAAVTVSVVDLDGNILGMVRDRDALVFGTDVSLQKARSAAFFSNPNSGPLLRAANFSDLVNATRDFLGSTSFNAGVGFSSRALGNIARPFYPDGVPDEPNGPLSIPIESWSIFNNGLQLDLIIGDVLTHVLFTLRLGTDVEAACTELPGVTLGDGLQIFSGGHPIYRGNQPIGGIGISGDGIDQDGMIAFLGLGNAGDFLDSIRPNRVNPNNPPPNLRASTLSPMGITFRYEQCPFAPFVQSNDQNVCDGL